MPVMDDIKKETLKTKDMSFKGKLSYFWYYYKVHTLVAIVSVFVIVTLVRDIAFAKDAAFRAVYFNARQTFSAEEQMNDFCNFAGIDTKQYETMLDNTLYYGIDDLSETTIASSQKFAAMIQAGDLDAIVADEEVFVNYAVNGLFYDLRDALSDELLEQYKDRLFYIDRAHIDAANDEEAYRKYYEGRDYYDESEYYTHLAKVYSNHTEPSLMEDPIPVGICVSDTPVIVSAGCYEGKNAIIGIPGNTPRLPAAIQYIQFLDQDITKENAAASN